MDKIKTNNEPQNICLHPDYFGRISNVEVTEAPAWSLRHSEFGALPAIALATAGSIFAFNGGAGKIKTRDFQPEKVTALNQDWIEWAVVRPCSRGR